MSVQATTNPRVGADARGRRLESWKEIAAYLGRDVTTVRRWEKREGLPVRRMHHSRLGSVYAYTVELDAWRNQRAPATAADAPDARQVPEVVGRGAHARTGAVFAVLALALLAGVIWIARGRTTVQPASARGGVRSLAVLPLENFSGNPEQDYLSDGMTEALIARLSAIPALRVISRTSAMQFKGTRKSVPAIAKELNVDAVIEGSVLRSGDKIRISVQLIRADTDEHLWSGTYDREMQDVLTLQSDVTRGIARQIEVAVNGPQRGLPVGPRTVAPDVYEAYLKGRFALNKNTQAGLGEALQHFQTAVAADPTFAPAYAGLATTYSALGLVFHGEPPSETRPKTIIAARKALELDPELAEARVLLANALQKDWRWEEAESEYRRALELSPNDAAAHAGLADWLLCQGRREEALASARRAQELDPLEFDGTQVGWILFQAHRYDEAIRELRTAVTMEPNNPMALWFLGYALIGAKRFDEAITTLEKAASFSDRSSAVLGVLVHAYASAGRRAQALRVVGELQQRRQKGYVPPAAFLNAYLGLGDKEQAFAWMERCAEERSNILQFLKVHPFFDPLRDDPRFAEFLRRANLSPAPA
ncbi:MAG TPA: tetratricopeptide repeat protein [Candidatus Acidoferrum sp.]|jgi:TolB-like protein/tetratricopeptide (TPR) repeat protein